MSKIKKITVSNLKAVSKLTIDFNGCTAIITGGNNKGKSSFLRSLPDRLRGNKPESILKHGEKEGFAEWELTSGEKFLWSFDGKKEKLIFTTERNIKTSITRDICVQYFPPVFDVDEFLNSSPSKQKQVLQKLTGVDFAHIDTRFKEAYDERTFANRKLAEEKAKLTPIDPKLEKKEKPIVDLEKELSGIAVHNLRHSTVVEGIKTKQVQLTANEKEILELEKKIKTIRDKSAAISEEISKGNTWLAEDKNKPKTNEKQLTADIQKIKKDNLAIIENNKAIKQQEVYEKAQLNATTADDAVKKIEAEKLDIIKNASMPAGFGFSDDGITYDGFAFNKETLSSSGIYIAALKLAAIGLGEVKTLHFDASFLDKNSLAEIERWAIQNDLQLLIERPDFEGGEIEYQILQEIK